jgi:hypothetical protein
MNPLPAACVIHIEANRVLRAPRIPLQSLIQAGGDLIFIQVLYNGATLPP